MRVLLDTNAILAVFNYKKDIFKLIREKYVAELYTTKSVIDELKSIANDPKRKGSERRNAKLALKLLEINNVKVLNLVGKTDKILEDLSKEFVIFTLDKELKN